MRTVPCSRARWYVMSVKAKPSTAVHADGSNVSDTPLSAREGMAAILAPVTVPPVTALAISAVDDLPEIEPGADLAALVAGRADLVDGDVVVVTSKVVSKAEGAIVELTSVVPSAFATRFAESWDKDPRLVEVVLRAGGADRADERADADHRDAPRVRVRQQRRRPVVERRRRAGGRAAARSRRLGRRGCAGDFAELGVDVAVIVSDTFGRPWREGQTDVAIGVAGMAPIVSYIGQLDPHGHEFRVQALCVADELAGAAELVKGNTLAGAGRGRSGATHGNATTRRRSPRCLRRPAGPQRHCFRLSDRGGRSLVASLAIARSTCDADGDHRPDRRAAAGR